jgi:hypothetical protein
MREKYAFRALGDANILVGKASLLAPSAALQIAYSLANVYIGNGKEPGKPLKR